MHPVSDALLAELDWPETDDERAEREAAEDQARHERLERTWGQGPEAEAGMAAAFAAIGMSPDEL